VVLALVSLPMALRKVPPNHLYGFRTQRTLSSPDIWYPANAFSGWAISIASTISLALLVLLPEAIFLQPLLPLALWSVPLLVSVLVSFVYLRRFS
jgi:uncharacterized membrane protein